MIVIGVFLFVAGCFIATQKTGSRLSPILIAAGLVLIIMPAKGRDLGQWERGDPAIRQWYQGLKMPDVPTASCCGEADAYWCDKINIRDGKTFCTITDDRPDDPLGRPHVDVGTEIEIPNHKLKWDEGNPTGHAIVFLSTSGFVYCFVQAGGV